jgi:hypothetical protein
MGKAAKQAKNKTLRIEGSKFNLKCDKLRVRRASDDAVITVDITNDDHWEKRLEVFCEGTDGYLCSTNYNY